MYLLVLNPGSSSLKFAVYAADADSSTPMVRGVVEPLNDPDCVLRIKLPESQTVACPNASISESVAQALSVVARLLPAGGSFAGIACRVVHGGTRFTEAVEVTEDILRAIDELSELAPLHNPLSVAAMTSARETLPGIPVVALFDTAFHKTLPPVARRYAIPTALAEAHGLYRYGFHGLSHRYVVEYLRAKTAPHPPRRVIVCHLGNGASVCATRDGESIATSMGLTPLEGLIMGTRSGDIDPGLILHLLRAGHDVDTVDTLLNKQSGLTGISGISGDMRDLKSAADAGNVDAAFAREAFAYRVASYVGAYTIALGGLDALIFTAGIGENDADIREQICGRLAPLGVYLSSDANRDPYHHDQSVASPESPVAVYVIPTDEELQMAKEASALLLSRS